MKSLKTFNGVKLYSYNSKNKVLIWYAESDLELDSEGRIPITIYYGQQDGKISQKIRYVNSGKNIGKSNETTIFEQTVLKLNQMYQQQLDNNYFTTKEAYNKPYAAVLAHKYDDKKHLINWKKDIRYASPKLNGIRCNIYIDSDFKITRFTSRTLKDFKYFHHISNTSTFYVNNCILDGELYHPEMPFECIAALVNSDNYATVTDESGREWSTSDIKYYFYDILYIDDLLKLFKDRIPSLAMLNSSSIELVSHTLVTSESHMIDLANQWISLGYEGLMLRDGLSKYDYGVRSNTLLKYKVMLDGEFLIKNIYLADNDPTKVQITCYINDTSFDVASVLGNKELNLEKYYNNRHLLIDSAYLTVNYQALSEYGVPLFPVGVDLRDGTIRNNTYEPRT